MKKLLLGMLSLALIALAGCSSESTQPAEKPQPKPAEYLTGRAAFQKLYVAAHGWARDAQAFRLESLMTSDYKGKDGKSAVWRASFASALGRSVKPYTWSGTDVADAPARGVDPGSEDTYSPNNSSTQVFDIQFLKVDSDKALEVAQKHGGDKIMEKAPDTPIQYVLDWNHNENKLEWHVLYGASREQPKLNVAVDATSGEFLRVEK
ncbi:MAG TPA: hypothetical protein VLV49_14150 [Terriglobales bacterium]|nr:hypothetical protein [Terriglobales bacterium]